MYLLIIVILALVLAFCGVILYFFNLAFARKFSVSAADMDENLGKELSPYSEVICKGREFMKNQPHEWYYTNSFDGLKLAARYYDNNSTCTILLFHGYRSSAVHDFSCAVEMYYKMGFNILLADQRAHGKSEGKYITFGVNESRDVLTWVEFVNQHFAPKQVIISGISMGATTVLLSLRLPLPQNVKGVIADCGFTSPAEIIAKVGKDSFKINAKPLIPFLNLACKFLGKFSITQLSTVDTVKNTDLPIMFIHGEKDTFVPCEMTKTTFKNCKDNCRMFLSREAGHGTSFLLDTEPLINELKSFLNLCIEDL